MFLQRPGPRHIGHMQDEKQHISLPESVIAQTFVVIPAYNESGALADVVSQVRAAYPNVVVVDDGSSDDTFTAARACATFALRHVVNRGQGAALQTGIEFALRRGAEYVVTFDADGQHRVEDIAALVSPIQMGSCDIALGSRFLGKAEDMSARRRLLLKGAILFTRVVNRLNLTDTHNGLRAFSRRAAERIDITLDRMAHASELMDLIRESGLPYREVPVTIRYTDYSKAKGQSAFGAIKIVLHYILGRVFQ